MKQLGNTSVATPSGALKAEVVVTGERATVKVKAVDVTGNVVPVKLVLLALPSRYPIKRPTTGELEAIVAPGKYRVEAYLAGQLLNATEFEVGPNEEKDITLVVQTVYFLAFDVVPAKNAEGKIGYAYVVATVRNLFKPLKNAEIILNVRYNGTTGENISVSKIPLLPLNDTEFKYNYIPVDGWKPGEYQFQMFLYSNGRLYAKTEVKTLKVTPEMVGTGGRATSHKTNTTNTYVYVGIGGVTIAALTALLLRKRSPIKVLDIAARDGKLIVRVENTSDRDAMLLRLNVLALPSKVKITEIEKPRLADGSRRIPRKASGIIEVPDEDGSIKEALDSGGIIVQVETNIGIGEAKLGK